MAVAVVLSVASCGSNEVPLPVGGGLGLATAGLAADPSAVNESPADGVQLDGDARTFAALEATELDVAGTGLQAGQPGDDVMQVKLLSAIETLLDVTGPNDEQLHLDAVDQIMEALFMSNLVILPTAGVPEADELVFQHRQMLQQAIDALNQHVQPGTNGTPASKDAAWEARNFLQVFQEAAEVIGEQTAFCDPENLRDPACQLLLAGDEGGVEIDDVYPGFSRQVRSPFFVGSTSHPIAQEQVILPGVIAPDECTIVLKEIQGVKAVVRKILIPIWVEPWYARATIVGYRTVWVWEFIPAEFLKTISYCNVNGSVQEDVEIIVVLERQLMHFWNFMYKEITLHE
jgi:hypothetical protein